MRSPAERGVTYQAYRFAREPSIYGGVLIRPIAYIPAYTVPTDVAT